MNNLPMSTASIQGRPWSRRLALGAASLLLAGAATWQAPVHAQTVQLPDFTELVERVGPSVVNIRTTEKRSNGELDPNVPNIEEFFRRFGIPMPNRPGAACPAQPARWRRRAAAARRRLRVHPQR